MSALATIPPRASLDHENVLDALLIAEMREEVGVEHFGRAARRVFRWANVFGFVVLPLVCVVAVAFIDLRWPL